MEAWPKSRVSRQIKAIERREFLALHPPVRESTREAIPPLSRKKAKQKWEAWFAARGWRPFPFQKKTWEAQGRGESGVLSVPTGSGKTYAAIGGTIIKMLETGLKANEPGRLRLLYIAPVKALANDIQRAIQKPLQEMGLPFTAGLRTGDTDTSTRAKLKKNLPEILITTPESLALLTAEKDWEKRFSSLETIIVDEWHELIGTKRGSLLELTLARVRASLSPTQIWAVSATLGNLREAGEVAIGSSNFCIVNDDISRQTDISAILPRVARPWFGNSGLRLKEELLAELDPRTSTILFTNARSQAEVWHHVIRNARPEWENILALHHGSLEREERTRLEMGVKEGRIRIVVATSSLDLGVDFPHVKKIIQIGSPKTVSRALQRSGRAEHSFGKKSHLQILPTSLFDLVETSALREALRQGVLEPKRALRKPIDVLIQFLMNSAYGEGFSREEACAWIGAAPSFREVTEEELTWCLNFLTGQGQALRSYDQYRKLTLVEGRYVFSTPRIARLHRMNIGTILATSGISVQFLGGKKIGYLDEIFVARLTKGSIFHFSGRAMELVQLRDMVAYVRLAKAKNMVPAVWSGQSFPVSELLSQLTRREFQFPSLGSKSEHNALAELLSLQALRSVVPAENEILIERLKTKEGWHTFIYLFAGRIAHEGIGHLLAHRFGNARSNTISVAANDQGLELLSTEPLGSDDEVALALKKNESLSMEIELSLNFPELSKRTFREIARVAGLVQQTMPGMQKTTRQLQMSTSVLYDVFASHDPGSLLLKEAREQTRAELLDFSRLEAALKRAEGASIIFKELKVLSPFALPLYAERVKSQVSTEKLTARIERLQKQIFGEV